VASGQSSAAVIFGFGFFRQSLLAIDGSEHAMEIGALRRKFDRLFQLDLRLG
jgi:hypothetical protein